MPERVGDEDETVHMDEGSRSQARERALQSRGAEDATDVSHSGSSASPLEHGGKLPERIGPYHVLEFVADGGMGLVLRARHETLHRDVALKLMRPEFANDKQFKDRFLREAKMAASVEHPAVVTVYDAGEADGFLFMALRFMPGGTLAELMKQSGPLNEEVALKIMVICSEGLEAIDEAGLVHRDIKPGNILMDRKGRPRIADLGLARAVEEKEGHTLAGAALGTPSYMSPEQAKGARDLDIRSDIYSLGVTFYAMITGKTPFKGSSVFDTVAKILYETPPSAKELQPSLSAASLAIIQKCMQKDREKRYRTPEELTADLDKALEALQSADPASAAAAPGADGKAPGKAPVFYRGVRVDDGEDSSSVLPREDSRSGEKPSSGGMSGLTSWFKKLKGRDESSTSTPAARQEDSQSSSSGAAAPAGPASPAKKRKARVYRGQVYYDDED